LGGLGCLATWHLSDRPIGLPVRWAATSDVEVGQMRKIVGHFIFRQYQSLRLIRIAKSSNQPATVDLCHLSHLHTCHLPR